MPGAASERPGERRGAAYILLVPIVGGLFALLWLGERVGLLSVAGAALTLVGLALGRDWLPRLRRRPSGA